MSITEFPLQVDGLLVVADGRLVMIEVAVGIAEAVQCAGFTATVAEFRNKVSACWQETSAWRWSPFRAD